MEKTYNLVELFSGIGSQAKALKNLGVKVSIQGTSEWDVHAIAAYDVIHNAPEMPAEVLTMSKERLLALLSKYTFSNTGKEPLGPSALRTYSVDVLRRLYTSIIRNKNYVDITRLDGASIPNGVDILTYSFPCQDLSNVGAFHGYNKGIDKNSGSRSSLLWQVGRILTEMKEAQKSLPRFLLLENVPTLLAKRHFDNFRTWISDLEELGYISHYYQLNATSFGLPQNRPRLLMISVYVGKNVKKWELVKSHFEEKWDAATIVSDYKESCHFTQYTVQQLLRTNYTNKKIFEEAVACTPNDTMSRRKIWEDNPKIVLPDGTVNPEIDAVRTITTKQDRNPNSGNLYFDSGIEGRSKYRYLTPRECLLFMGFTDEDFKRLKFNNAEFHKGDALFARDKIIRMAGNSIPVKLLEGVFYQILMIDKKLEECENTREISEQQAREAYSAIIRSHAFKCGIRSRIKEDDPYPKNATVVYPKYKTAVYVQGCGSDRYVSNGLTCHLCDHTYWEKHCPREDSVISKLANEAQELGWSAVVLRACEFNAEVREDTLNWIVQCVQQGITAETHGSVYSRS